MTSASAEESLELSLDESAKESDDDDDDDDNGSVEEGSDAMEDFDSDHEEEEKNVKKKPPPEAPLKVIEVSTGGDGTGHKKADRAVKHRIIKLLNSLSDESNKDAEKNAKLALRLMKKHNLSQEILHEEHRREASTMYATTTTVYRINETPCLLPSSPGGVSDEDKKPAAKGSTVAEEDNDNDCEDEDESLSQTGTP
jgi:hypothetical protein